MPAGTKIRLLLVFGLLLCDCFVALVVASAMHVCVMSSSQALCVIKTHERDFAISLPFFPVLYVLACMF